MLRFIDGGFDIKYNYWLLDVLLSKILTRKLFMLSGPKFVETLQNDSLANLGLYCEFHNLSISMLKIVF